jgi:hypothetical protein
MTFWEESDWLRLGRFFGQAQEWVPWQDKRTLGGAMVDLSTGLHGMGPGEDSERERERERERESEPSLLCPGVILEQN